MDDKLTLSMRDVRRRFDRAARSFDSADFVHTVTREGLCARLDPLLVQANTVLDLGAATGSAGALLRKRFRRAHVVSLDLSHRMLREGAKKRPWFSRPSQVQATATKLPFAGHSFDVVFANLVLPWIDRPELMLAEVSRVLRDGGVFAFATLGPDSLLELAQAWRRVDTHAHVGRFPDMHDVGDALLRAGIIDPVLDVDRLTVTYENAERLFADLTSVGARNTLDTRNSSLLGKRRFGRVVAALEELSEGGSIRLDLELVYGHGWRGGTDRLSPDYRVDAKSIPLRRP